jgi:F-type H+-transporting ATPase subunit a
MSASPIDQFKIKIIGSDISISGVNLSFTNAALFMSITALLVIIFFYFLLKKTQIVPNKMQMIAELSYDFVQGIAKDNLGDGGKKFFPFIYSIFMFFLFGNLIGLIPFSFAFTSHIAITVTIALLIFTVTTVYGFYKHGLSFFNLFVPSGIPIFLIPLMFVIEIISYIAKALSMGIRLFANVMSAHIIMEIITGFIIAMGIFGIIPLAFTSVLFVLEFAVSCLQAYILTILACLFIQQAVEIQH